MTMITFSGIIVGGKKLRRDIIVPHVNFFSEYIRRVESNENKFIFILVSLFLSVILSKHRHVHVTSGTKDIPLPCLL